MIPSLQRSVRRPAPPPVEVIAHAEEEHTRCRSAAVSRSGGTATPQEGGTMQVEPPVCGGLDVHTDPLPACRRRVDANGQVSQAGREGATPSPSLLAFSDWRIAPPGPVVAMASTGVYGKPVYHVLAGTVEVCI